MDKLILKINHIVFYWYYNHVPQFFRKWTFFKSVSLLIQNYTHNELLFRNELKNNQNLIKDNDIMRKELSDIRIKQVASNMPNGDHLIDWANINLGANIHKDREN